MGSPLLPTTTFHDGVPARRFPEPPVDPRLLWPSVRFASAIEDEDLSFFPSRERILGRYAKGKNDGALKLLAFEAAVINSEGRILVLDPHFDERGARVLGRALSSSRAFDVRLLTGSGDIDRDTRTRLEVELTHYPNLNRSRRDGIEVRWNTRLDKRTFPFLHDRFSIVDGGLWHFGSTVGGSHPGLTAASGPWSTAATRAVEFFEECWSLCNA